MKWNPQKKWDGETYKADVIKALMHYFDSGIQRQALLTSYGDLAVLMKAKYKTSSLHYDAITIFGTPQGVIISGMFKIGKHIDYCITWNKAAKLIYTECHRLAEK